METIVLNYRIIIKPTKADKKTIYLAECSTLGVYDWGSTIEEALKNIREAIACEVEGLAKDGEVVPVDHVDEELVTATNIPFSFATPRLAFS